MTVAPPDILGLCLREISDYGHTGYLRLDEEKKITKDGQMEMFAQYCIFSAIVNSDLYSHSFMDM